MANVFRKVGRAPVVYSNHDLSYEVKTDARFGLLYPVMRKHMVPGDVFRISNEIVVRMMPMIAPILHEVNVFVHYFFCPYRILWEGWEDWITQNLDETPPPLPLWDENQEHPTRFKLYDYMHFDVGMMADGIVDPKVHAFPRTAYNMIWNEYYRDEQIQEEIPLDQNELLHRSWAKDYFTSARLEPMDGTPPAIPIDVGSLDLSDLPEEWFPISYPQDPNSNPGIGPNLRVGVNQVYPASSGAPFPQALIPGTMNPNGLFPSGVGGPLIAGTDDRRNANAKTMREWLQMITFNLQGGINANDVREVFQITKWLERNVRAGKRYTEFIRSRFPAYPRDYRLQRPEYVGGSRSPVIISEVLQTTADSSSTISGNVSPQGNMAGHGITADRTYVGKYKADEYGVIMGLMSVMPTPVYATGNDREFTVDNPFDFFFPEFQQLGEQAILGREILFTNGPTFDDKVWGYQGRYNHLRYSASRTVGLMRPSINNPNMAHWHMARFWNPTFPPHLNDEFLKCNPDMRNFAVTDEPPMLVNFGNIIHATRPMVAVPNPGFIDHF